MRELKLIEPTLICQDCGKTLCADDLDVYKSDYDGYYYHCYDDLDNGSCDGRCYESYILSVDEFNHFVKRVYNE